MFNIGTYIMFSNRQKVIFSPYIFRRFLFEFLHFIFIAFSSYSEKNASRFGPYRYIKNGES